MLSPHTAKKIEAAAIEFARTIAGIVASDSATDLIGHLRAELDQLEGRSGTAARRRGTQRKSGSGGSRRKPANYQKLLPRLVAMLEKGGGRIKPGTVSKELGLSPEQRRTLVALGRRKRLVKITGSRRSTVYQLVTAGKKTGAKRKPSAKKSRTRKRAGKKKK